MSRTASISPCGRYRYGQTASGAPRHPLYVKGDAPLVPFSPPSTPHREGE